IKEKVGVIHGVVHAVAFADTNELKGEYADTSRDGFLMAQEISAYSLVSVTKEARKLMTEDGSIVTQTYLGSEKVVKNYNVMGEAKDTLKASVRYLYEHVGSDKHWVDTIYTVHNHNITSHGLS